MPRRGKRRTVAKNIYADAAGLEAVVRVTVDGVELTRSKRYDRDEKISVIRTWQRDTAAELHKLTGVVAKTTFSAEVEIYLPLVRAELASFADRERDLRAWIPRFGPLKRRRITTAAIDQQLRTWRNVDGLSASSVNHRRDALSDFFVKLGGPDGSNPVKGAVWFPRKKSAPKGIDRARIWRVLEHMDPDRKTRWRLSLMHWTGMRPSQMGRLGGADDFYLGDRAFIVDVNGAPRRVPAVIVPAGKGGDPVMFPLTEEGEAVAREFVRVDAFWRQPVVKQSGQIDEKLNSEYSRRRLRNPRPRQTWSCPSAYKRIVAAAKAVGEPPFTVYQIKHSFASALLQTGTDASVIQEMLGHADIKSTLVYARAVRATHVQALDRLRLDDARRYDQQAAAAGSAGAEIVAPNRGSDIDAA